MNGKRVVLRKPKLNMDKQIDLTPTPSPQNTAKIARAPPEKSNPKPISSTQKIKKDPKVIKEMEKEEIPVQEKEDELELSEELLEDPPEILKTSSNRTIKATKMPELAPEPESAQPSQTFDEKFIDNLDIKSKITKDSKTLEKLQKREIKPVLKSKLKPKKKFNLFIIISFAALIGTSYFAYITLLDYMAGIVTASLAYFIYVVATVVLAFMMLMWFVIEIFVRNKI